MNPQVIKFLAGRVNLDGVRAPEIFMAVLVLYCNGYRNITAAMVRDTCNQLFPDTPWNDRIPAICNAFRNCEECGARYDLNQNDTVHFAIHF